MERLLFARTDPAVNFDWDLKSLAGSEVIQSGPTIALELPPGCYRAEWLDTKSGAIIKRESIKQGGGAWQAKFPDFKNDIALRVRGCGE
jgi:hypothetical protein